MKPSPYTASYFPPKPFWKFLFRIQNLVTVLTLVAQTAKRLPKMQETWVRSLGREDPLEKEMVTQSSILAWEIPWTEEPCGLQPIGLQRAGHNLETKQQQPLPRFPLW